MSIPCKFERSILSHDEYEIVLPSHHPPGLRSLTLRSASASAWRGINRVSEPAPCLAQRALVLVRLARGEVAAAAAITRLMSEWRYERRAVSAAAVPASALARSQGRAQRPIARKVEGT